MILGDIVLRVVKIVKGPVMEIFDDLGGLYRAAILVGVGPQSLTDSSLEED